MVVVFWLITLTIFIITSFFLITYLFKNVNHKEIQQTLLNGLKEAFKGSGFNVQKRRYPVELYEWVAMDDEEVCEDCLDRTSWPPMDIADWMKEGLPRTPEAETHCGKNCRCQLVPYRPKVRRQKNNLPH